MVIVTSIGTGLYSLEPIVEVVSALLTIGVWYYSLKAFRFLRSVSMLFLSSAFLLFTLGLLIQASYAFAAYSSIRRYRPLFFGEGYLLYSILEFAGYVVLTYAYSLSPGEDNLSLLFVPFIFRDLFSYAVQAATTVLIVYILSKIYYEHRSKGLSYSKDIGIGFGLMLVQHVVRLVELSSQPVYFASSVIQLAGFAFIFYAVWQVNSR